MKTGLDLVRESRTYMEKGTKNNRKKVLTPIVALILLLIIPFGIKFCKDNSTKKIADSLPEVPELTTDSVSAFPVQDSTGITTPPGPITVTVTSGMTLRHLSGKYYNNKIFWPYIYEENRDKIKNVHTLALGTVLVIPAPEKYGIDPNDPASLAKARKKAAEILAMPGQEEPGKKQPPVCRESETGQVSPEPADTVFQQNVITPEPDSRSADTLVIRETPVEDPESTLVIYKQKQGIPVMSLKTNLLEWCGLIINGEIEWYFGRHFSLNAEYNYANWLFKDDDRQWRGGVISPEFRYWFSRDLFRRHYLGVYGQLGEYNVKPKKYGYQGDFYSMGLSYGYSFLLNRHLNLELGIGLGYMRTKYDKYIKLDNCYPYINTTTKEYWGVTKLKVSLVYNFWTK